MSDIVSLIKKMAQGAAPAKKEEPDPFANLTQHPGAATPAAAPATGTPATGTPPTPAAPAPTGWKAPWDKPSAGAGGKPVVIKNPDVEKMQQAILDFANIASSSDVTSMNGNKDGRQEGDQSRAVPNVSQELSDKDKIKGSGFLSHEQGQELAEQTKNKKKFLKGSDPFGDLIVQYIPKEGLGKQYLNVDVAGAQKREGPGTIAPSDLRGVIDSIKRIGTPDAKGERVPDGQWGTRTNNSLHLIGDLIEAMLNFTKHMQIQVQGYTEQNLQEYKSKVPTDYKSLKSQDDFSKAAKELTPHLRAMTEYFRYLNGKVFNNQRLRKYIDQKQSFTKYDQALTDPEVLKQIIPIGLNGQKTNIALSDLVNMTAFKKYVNTLLGNPSAPQSEDTYRKFLNTVVEQINGNTTNVG